MQLENKKILTRKKSPCILYCTSSRRIMNYYNDIERNSNNDQTFYFIVQYSTRIRAHLICIFFVYSLIFYCLGLLRFNTYSAQIILYCALGGNFNQFITITVNIYKRLVVFVIIYNRYTSTYEYIHIQVYTQLSYYYSIESSSKAKISIKMYV